MGGRGEQPLLAADTPGLVFCSHELMSQQAVSRKVQRQGQVLAAWRGQRGVRKTVRLLKAQLQSHRCL